MGTRETPQQPKKQYATPSVVDFGSIELTTGDCSGFCTDGTNGGMNWFAP